MPRAAKPDGERSGQHDGERSGKRSGERSGKPSGEPGLASTWLARWDWLVRHPFALWGLFVFVHVLIVLLCIFGAGWPLGDVETVYRRWAVAADSGAYRVGIDTQFVYPIVAFIPIMLPLVFGVTWYPLTWLGLVTLLNAGTFAFLIGRRESLRRVLAAWWWLGFLLLLGPISLARIDSVTVPLVIIALLWLRSRPLWGTALLAIATWVKVWPAAIIAALFVASKHRWRMLAAAAGTSGLIVALALILGSGWNVFSFITEQTGRGIQIESPVSLIWLWQSAFGVDGAFVYYDKEILTYQVTGNGVEAAAAVMTPLLALAVILVVLLGWRAVRAGASFSALFPPLVLALVVTLIAFNKVGSPQFIGWLAAPVILGLVVRGRAWRTPALLVAVTAGLTQIIYPYLYNWLLATDPSMLVVLSLRNLLEFVILAWAVIELWTARSPTLQSPPLKE